MRYHYLRLFLLEQERPPILEAAGTLPRATSRQEFLKQIFSSRIDFKHWNKTLVYIPIGEAQLEGGPVMLGRIGRAVAAVENTPPESGFEETTHTSWRAANVLIDTRDHADGQKLAFQYHANVGKPLPIASSLIEHINSTNQDSGWLIEINLITERDSFWDAVRRHKGEITAAEFMYVTPNILGIRSKLNDDLKEARQKYNAVTVTETIENPKGNLKLEGEEIEQTVEYISEGGGKSKLKVGRKVVYDSDQEEKLIEIEEDEQITKENTSTWKRITDIIF